MTWFILIGLGILYFIAFRFMQFAGEHSNYERQMEDEYQIQFLKEKKRKKEQKINDHLHFLRHGYIKRN